MEIYQERQFIIFNTSELEKINFSEVLDDSAVTLRKNVDGSKAVVKWYGEIPNSVYLLNDKEGPYTHEEILNILSQEEWQNIKFL